MNEYTHHQLKSLIDLAEQALNNKENVYAIKEYYQGSELDTLTDREGFLEYVLTHIQNVLIDETVQKEIER